LIETFGESILPAELIAESNARQPRSKKTS